MFKDLCIPANDCPVVGHALYKRFLDFFSDEPELGVILTAEPLKADQRLEHQREVNSAPRIAHPYPVEVPKADVGP
jgi:hypothetical protein